MLPVLLPQKPTACEGPPAKTTTGLLAHLNYLLIGVAFGVVSVKAEIISWFRIQEMFRLDSFHMYGVIGSAVLTGMLSVWLIKRFAISTRQGEAVRIAPKMFHWRQLYGGLLFGLGLDRGLSGAAVCPNRQWVRYGSHYAAECPGWYVGVWLPTPSASPLMATLSVCINGR